MTQLSLTKGVVQEITEFIQRLFLEDEVPWVVGYSGGKDSTATLQLVWYALASLSADQRNRKTVYVISTDTLVEQPVVARWVSEAHDLIRRASVEQDMPIVPHRLTPKTKDTYWVNLLGRGYPAPRQTFRWCTSRLKIAPSNSFILNVLKSHGEAVLVLGIRKAESSRRSAIMSRHESRRTRDYLSPNASLPNSQVFSPIESWSNDDVWLYLMQYQNPWGRSNKALMQMYRGASLDNDCPIILDTTTPSCGSSRFGCWVCTLVSVDRSMEAMIQNDGEKVWMTPLLDLRNEIGVLGSDGAIDDRDRRDYRRMDGSLKLKADQAIHGPYTKRWREYLLRRLLGTQEEIRRLSPGPAGDIVLITPEELREIRRIWVQEKHEFDDTLPGLYEEMTGCPYPFKDDLQPHSFSRSEWELLEELCEGDHVRLDMLASMIDLAQKSRESIVRKPIKQELEGIIRRCFYESEEDAVAFHRHRSHLRGSLLIQEDPDGQA
ncbi:MAG TPA: DNA phosphorothioation system sulfurtransferase DndC [Dissulfurispiraceae bacterium]|nr:DNA phosphorothioation system sulfurtransferase DndC [Dissulfurispiraceae bacterium]